MTCPCRLPAPAQLPAWTPARVRPPPAPPRSPCPTCGRRFQDTALDDEHQARQPAAPGAGR